MKIAYFINQYPKVSHSFIRREILALERHGFQVLRIALHGWNGDLPDPEDRGERERTRHVLRGGIFTLFAPTLRIFLSHPYRFMGAMKLALQMARDSDRSLPYHLVYLAEACRMLPWLRAFGARHIHAHFGTNSAEIVMLINALDGSFPYSFTVHGPDEFFRPYGLNEKIRRSSFVVAVSSFGCSQLYLRCRSQDWHKVKVVRCGIENSFYDMASVPIPEAPTLVCVGRLCEAKGQLLLIRAAAQLAAQGVTFQLVLAGDGPLRAELEAEVRRHSLSTVVHITGWLSSNEVRNQILAARALVLPSFAEGLPVVLMEAMALHRPVLTTYIAGIPELVRPGEDGWLIPAGSVQELAAAMQRCLETPVQQLQCMGDAAFTRVIALHSIEAESARLAALFIESSPKVD